MHSRKSIDRTILSDDEIFGVNDVACCIKEQPGRIRLDNILTAKYTVIAGPQRKHGGTVKVMIPLHFDTHQCWQVG